MCIGGGSGAGDAGGGGAGQQMTFYDPGANGAAGRDAGGSGGGFYAEAPKPAEAAPAAAPAAAAPAAAPITPAVNAPSLDPGRANEGGTNGGTEPAGLARFGERYYRSKMRSVASFGSVGGYSGKGSTLGTT